MSKGKQSKIGDENVSANGYTYVKTSTGWRLKHHLVAEKKIGRNLTKMDRVSFGEKGRTCFDPSNIIVSTKAANGTSGLSKRLTTVEDKMIAYVEDHSDKGQALQDLRDCLNDVRGLYKFGVI